PKPWAASGSKFAASHPTLRSIRPTRARRPSDASVDPTEARYSTRSAAYRPAESDLHAPGKRRGGPGPLQRMGRRRSLPQPKHQVEDPTTPDVRAGAAAVPQHLAVLAPSVP